MSSKIDESIDSVIESQKLPNTQSKTTNKQTENNPMMYITPPDDSVNPSDQFDEKKNEPNQITDHAIEYKQIDETPTFSKDDRNPLENILYDYFIQKDLIKLETKIDKTVLQQLDLLTLTETDISQFLTDVMTGQHRLKLFAQIPHQHTTWKSIYFQAKNNNQWTERIKLWNLIQHQTVHLITNVYNFPADIQNQLEHCIFYSDENPPRPVSKDNPPQYLNKMEIGTMNTDCIVAGIKLKKAGYNPIILNLANQEAPAAATHQRSEGGTQEENLFKRSTYYLSLWPHRNPNRNHQPVYDYFSVFGEEDDDEELYFNANEIEQKQNEKANKKEQIKGFYPMDNKFGGVYSKNVYTFRGSEQSGYVMLPLNQRCVLSFIAVAAQIHYGGDTLSQQEIGAFEDKIRTIYRIALENGHNALVLGAMGCGIFGNPPMEVAKIFHDILVKEFNGCFARVMFAILWDHNSQPQLVQSFMKYFPKNDKIFEKI